MKKLNLNICMTFMVILSTAYITFCTGWENLPMPEIFVEDEAGQIQPNLQIGSIVDKAGDTAQNLGVPYAGLAGEFWLVITGLIAVVLREHNQRKKKKELKAKASESDNLTSVLITSVEHASENQAVKEKVKEISSIHGIESKMHTRVKALT